MSQTAITVTVPVSDADPFCRDFFDDPYPVHAALRDAGPAVWLRRYGVWAVTRHADVRAMLNNWQDFCSGRGVGLSDFARETPWRVPSLVLEADPTQHTRARAVLQRVLSPATVRGLRAGFAAVADAMVAELLTRDAPFDAVADLAEAFPLRVFPDSVGLRADPRLARGAFDEAIRFESPVQTFFRTTTRATDIGGTSVAEGDKVLMFLASANRDPRRWEAPDRYDITRNTGGHVGFGDGIHMCVGQIVARLEGEVLLAALARQVARIEIAGPIRRRYNNTMRGLESLPLRLVALHPTL